MQLYPDYPLNTSRNVCVTIDHASRRQKVFQFFSKCRPVEQIHGDSRHILIARENKPCGNRKNALSFKNVSSLV